MNASLHVLGAPSAVQLEPSAGRAIIRKHSKSFSLASMLLGKHQQRNAVALYAYCRRADDAVDLVPAGEALGQVTLLRIELDAVYAGRALSEPVLAEFQRIAFEKRIPRAYPEALLQGFLLDAMGAEYETMADLYRYCWCVAGSVGAMMCHVLGVRRERAVLNGVHLGMAMQLTNICRDVAEDWERGRLYVPTELLPGPKLYPSARVPTVLGEEARSSSPQKAKLFEPPLHAAAPPISTAGVSHHPSTGARCNFARAIQRLLAEAEVLYRSGDLGLPYLSFRSRLGVATARRVYSAIGARLMSSGADAWSGRAVVPAPEKLWLLGQACTDALLVQASAPRFHATALRHTLRFPEDVLPH